MKKTILITGGAGFIGSHLVDKLVQANNIIVIDNLSTGYLKNLDNVFDKIRFIKNDVENFDFSGLGKIDVIVHLSAQTSVPLSIENFKKSSCQNVLSSLNVIFQLFMHLHRQFMAIFHLVMTQ